MVWDFRNPAMGRMEFFPMAGIEAGVVGQAEVSGLPSGPGAAGRAFALPSTWAYIWAGLAFAYLLAIYLGMIRIHTRG